jgi:hypothetical protein
VVALVAAATVVAGAADSLDVTLERVGARVAAYYANAQSIVAEETVRIQNESRDMRPEGFAQVFVYETRIEMTPASNDERPLATFIRQLVKVGSRAPDPRAKEPPDKCTTNQSGRPTPEPLSDLLPGNRRDFTFRVVDHPKLDGRASILLEYKPIARGKAIVKWTKECLDTNLPPDYYRNRVWVDAVTYDVLRIDQDLIGPFTVDVPFNQLPFAREPRMTMTSDSESTRYQLVTFADPDETLILPRSSQSVVAWSAVAAPRIRTTQVFANYRRFVGQSHLVEAEQPPGL